ncbi:hypothetical protein [Actinomadura decatromicini]|nr:hypothetical protein [Actinomadura decatromicini]
MEALARLVAAAAAAPSASAYEALIQWAREGPTPTEAALQNLVLHWTRSEPAEGEVRPGGDAVSMRTVLVDDDLAAEAEEQSGDEPLGSLVERLLRDWLARQRVGDFLEAADEKAGPLTEDELEKGRQVWRGQE